MAIDVRQLRPSILTRMLNSTPLGYCISERQLRRHRNRAGYRIGDEKHVDLLRYTAWLVWSRHNPEPTKPPLDYEAMKEARARTPSCRHRRTSADIVRGQSARGRAHDFVFADAFPETFSLPWSQDHLNVIAKIETAATRRTLCDGHAARQR